MIALKYFTIFLYGPAVACVTASVLKVHRLETRQMAGGFFQEKIKSFPRMEEIW